MTFEFRNGENRTINFYNPAQVVAGGSATFVFDAIGNIPVKWHQGLAPMTMTFDVASRLLTLVWGATTTGYTYDAAGNMTSENQAGAITGYVYDGENRQIKVTNPDFSLTTCTYQGSDGMRRTKQDPDGAVRTMVWDGSDYLGEI